MRGGDKICVGIALYDAQTKKYLDFDTVKDVTVRIYTDPAFVKALHAKDKDLERKSRTMYCAYFSTRGMKSGAMWCEYHTVSLGGHKSQTYRMKIGYLKEEKHEPFGF